MAVARHGKHLRPKAEVWTAPQVGHHNPARRQAGRRSPAAPGGAALPRRAAQENRAKGGRHRAAHRPQGRLHYRPRAPQVRAAARQGQQERPGAVALNSLPLHFARVRRVRAKLVA